MTMTITVNLVYMPRPLTDEEEETKKKLYQEVEETLRSSGVFSLTKDELENRVKNNLADMLMNI